MPIWGFLKHQVSITFYGLTKTAPNVKSVVNNHHANQNKHIVIFQISKKLTCINGGRIFKVLWLSRVLISGDFDIIVKIYFDTEYNYSYCLSRGFLRTIPRKDTSLFKWLKTKRQILQNFRWRINSLTRYGYCVISYVAESC